MVMSRKCLTRFFLLALFAVGMATELPAVHLKPGLNVAANTLSDNGLILQVKVDDGLEPGFYEIPLVLKDEANHSWSFTLSAELASQKPASYELGQNYPN